MTTPHHAQERVTVNLTQRASAALAEAMELTGDTKTDCLNKALLVYAMVRKAQQEGGALYLRNDGELERVRFL